MKRAIWLAVAVSSCVLPKFGVDPSFDDTGGGGGSSGAGNQTGGKPSTGGDAGGGIIGSPDEGGDGGSLTSSGSPSGGSDSGGDATDTGGSGGACESACDANATCVDSECRCNTGWLFCGGTCVIDGSDTHCGSCTKACDGPQMCSSNTCQACPTGCAALSVVGALSSSADFSVTFNSPVNLGTGTIKFRVRGMPVETTLASIWVTTNVASFENSFYAIKKADGWMDLRVINVNGWDLSAVTKITLRVIPNQNEASTLIYVDSLSVDNNAFAPVSFATDETAIKYEPSSASGSVSWIGP